MPTINTITPDKLSRLIGTPRCQALIDSRTGEEFQAELRLIRGTVRRPWKDVSDWASELEGRSAVIICRKGLTLSRGAAACLRHESVPADALERGTVAWDQAGLPMVPASKLPPSDLQGLTVWVTRARPKVDRIACPWLIRRSIDPSAVFLFGAPSEVLAVADRFEAAPFDIEGEGVFWSHRGERCTFDTMMEEFGLATEPLLRLASMIRGAGTARLDIAPQAAGLPAASPELSRMYVDNMEQREAGLTLDDGFYRSCRDATEENHNWPARR